MFSSIADKFVALMPATVAPEPEKEREAGADSDCWRRTSLRA